MKDTYAPMGRTRAMFYIFLCALMWASGGVLVKLIDAHPLTISGVRALVALPALLLIYKPRTLRFTKKVWLLAASLALTGIFFIFANKLTTAANAIVLQYLSPVFIILFSRIFFKERVLKADVFVSIACIFGMSMLFFDEISLSGFLGNIFAICSGVTNAILVMTMNRTSEDRGTIIVAAQIETVLVTLPFMFLYPPEFTALTVAAFIALGVFQRGLSTVIYARSAPHCSAMDAAIVSVAEPLANPLLVMIFFSEKPGRFALVGGIIVIIAVLLWNVIKIRSIVPAQD